MCVSAVPSPSRYTMLHLSTPSCMRATCTILSRSFTTSILPRASTSSSAAVPTPARTSTFAGAFTSSSNPNVTPHYAPKSHAPTSYSKNRAQFVVDNPAVRGLRDNTRKSRSQTSHTFVFSCCMCTLVSPFLLFLLLLLLLLLQLQRSAQEYIDDVPVIEVDGPTAICDGGDPRLGHPIQFIQLNKVHPETPSTCKYCGLRFIQAHGHHHH